jgi:hypothetical protein
LLQKELPLSAKKLKLMQMNMEGVKKARAYKKKGWTNYKIAKTLGVDITQVTRWLQYKLPNESR